MTPSPAILVAVGVFALTLVAAAAVHAWLGALQTAAVPAPRSAIRTPVQVGRVQGWLARAATPAEATRRQALGDLVVQAGWEETAFVPFLVGRSLATLALPVVAWLVLRPVTLPGLAGTVVGGALAGYYLPLGALVLVARARARRIREAVPNLLDMLVSCVDAGLGIDMAMRHVAHEIRVASPELADELDRANEEAKAGVARVEALGRLERRTGVADLGALAQVLGVVERFGSGISQSLRAHAHLSRRRRALRAEQRAATAAPALTIVMVIFILPALFVVLMGPMLVRLSGWFFPAVSGGTL